MLQMIQYQTGERRVIDAASMTASEFLAHSEMNAPLEDYALDCTLSEADLAQEHTVLR